VAPHQQPHDPKFPELSAILPESNPDPEDSGTYTTEMISILLLAPNLVQPSPTSQKEDKDQPKPSKQSKNPFLAIWYWIFVTYNAG
jgi:hypothetical protein